jgi:opacity protein-like surface antigen
MSRSISSFILFLGLLSISIPALAYPEVSYRNSSGASYLHGTAGFGVGGIAIGADYERIFETDVGIGGMGRFYTGEDKRGGARIFFIGAFVRPHWPKGAWDFFVTPGVGLASVKLAGNSETMISPTLGMGVGYAMSQSITLGVESQMLYGITSDDFPGPYEIDIMFKMRFRMD